MPPKRQAASKRKAEDDDNDAAPAASSKSKAAASSTKKQGSKGGAKAARKSKNADAEDADATGEMDDEAPTSSSPAAAAAAAPAPKLKGKAAKLAAALASSASAPIHRCDADSLSHVFSFLSTREFLTAIAVSRSFRAARMKHTAWPKLNLDSFIQSLRDDNYSDGARRRLDVAVELGLEPMHRLASVALGRSLEQVRAEYSRIGHIRYQHAAAIKKATKAGAPLPELPADLTHLLTTPAAAGSAECVPSMWRHVTDIRLRVDNACLWGDGVRNVEMALQHLAMFPYASAININAGRADYSYDDDNDSSRLRPESVRLMYEKLAEAKRIEAVLLFSIEPVFFDGLSLLASTLKVLVLDCQSPASVMSTLVNLAYLHFESSTMFFHLVPAAQAAAVELGLAIRWLSMNHALRSLSVAKDGTFYSSGLGFVLMPPFVAGATPEQGGPTGATHSHWALEAAKAEAARPADSPLPRVDWSQPCGLTDITLASGLTCWQFAWLSRIPLVRLELGVGTAPRQGMPDPTVTMEPVSCFARLQVLRVEFNAYVYQNSGFTVTMLGQCTQLRVLQLSSNVQSRTSQLKQSALNNLLRANANTLEELRIGQNCSVDWDAPEPQWALGRTADATAATAATASSSGSAVPVADAASSPAASCEAVPAADAAVAAVASSAAASSSWSSIPAMALREWPSLLGCTQLRIVELMNKSVPPAFLAALACLPSFHSLELILTEAQFSLPPNLGACVSHSRSWSSVCLSLHEHSSLNLLRIAGGLAKLIPTDGLSESAVHRLRIYGFKDGKRQVLAVQTDKKGGRKWASIEGPFATVVV